MRRTLRQFDLRFALVLLTECENRVLREQLLSTVEFFLHDAGVQL